MSNSSKSADRNGDASKWDGFSNYSDVSSRIVNAVDLAAECEATLRARHQESAKINHELASELRAGIQAAINKLYPEIEREATRGSEVYEEFLTKLEGGEEVTGLIESFQQANFQIEAPDEINELVVILRSAAWELGYYQAGRTEKERSAVGEYDGEVIEMIEGM